MSTMLCCEECRCVSDDARDWIAKVVEGDDEEPIAAPYVITYCPTCAEREFGRTPRNEYT